MATCLVRSRKKTNAGMASIAERNRTPRRYITLGMAGIVFGYCSYVNSKKTAAATPTSCHTTNAAKLAIISRPAAPEVLARWASRGGGSQTSNNAACVMNTSPMMAPVMAPAANVRSSGTGSLCSG